MKIRIPLMLLQILDNQHSRGSMGDLIFISKTPLDGTEIEDVHKDVLLQRIEVWSEEIGEPTEWRYVFLKN